jgi:hypothetical protein
VELFENNRRVSETVNGGSNISISRKKPYKKRENTYISGIPFFGYNFNLQIPISETIITKYGIHVQNGDGQTNRNTVRSEVAHSIAKEFALEFIKRDRWHNSKQTCRTSITFSQYAMQCNAMQCNTMQYNAMQCNTIQCNAMACTHNAMQCNNMYGSPSVRTEWIRSQSFFLFFFFSFFKKIQKWQNLVIEVVFELRTSR